MSIRKHVRNDMPRFPAQKKFSVDKAVRRPTRVLPDVEATTLEIDDEYAVDCDPYNRTGQHCVEALRHKKHRGW